MYLKDQADPLCTIITRSIVQATVLDFKSFGPLNLILSSLTITPNCCGQNKDVQKGFRLLYMRCLSLPSSAVGLIGFGPEAVNCELYLQYVDLV
jgi:hypothetical protein